jgi:high-affinity iron transporter
MLTAFLAAFVLFLREGLEAALIVSILFAALRQLGQTQQMRAVWAGVALAVLGSLAGGVVVYATVREFGNASFEPLFEAAMFLVAVVLLTSMTFWMQKHSRTMKKELTAKAGAAGSGFALGVLAFTTVGREGIETAAFMVAFAFQSNALLLLFGALLGVLAAVGLCYMIYRLGYRLDFRVFFRVMGMLLLIFAAGLLANAVHELQEVGVISFGTTALWNTSGLLSDESSLGGLLHGILGYSAEPSILQAIAYVIYLATAGILFWRATRKPQAPQAAVSSSSGVVASKA